MRSDRLFVAAFRRVLDTLPALESTTPECHVMLRFRLDEQISPDLGRGGEPDEPPRARVAARTCRARDKHFTEPDGDQLARAVKPVIEP